MGVRAYIGGALNNTTLRAIWRHSLACELLADEVAMADSVDKESANTTRPMHNVGSAFSPWAPPVSGSYLADRNSAICPRSDYPPCCPRIDRCHLVLNWARRLSLLCFLQNFYIALLPSSSRMSNRFVGAMHLS